MRPGWHVVAAILLYLVLDLCLASMPGAFVFDAADSVETVQRQRLHDTDAPVRAVIRDPRDVVIVPYRVPARREAALDTTASPWMPPRAGADRSSAAAEFAARSEDPH